VLTDEKLDDKGARLEYTPRKSLKHLAQDTGVSKSSAKKAAQTPKLKPYKTTVNHSLQLRQHFCSWFLQSDIEG
jgi:hypothetical protein